MFPPMRDRESLHSPLHLEPLPSEEPWGGKIAYLDRDGVIIRGSRVMSMIPRKCSFWKTSPIL